MWGDTQVWPVAPHYKPGPSLPLCRASRSPRSQKQMPHVGVGCPHPRGPCRAGPPPWAPHILSGLRASLQLICRPRKPSWNHRPRPAGGGCPGSWPVSKEGAGVPARDTPLPQPTPLMPGEENKTQPSLSSTRKRTVVAAHNGLIYTEIISNLGH